MEKLVENLLKVLSRTADTVVTFATKEANDLEKMDDVTRGIPFQIECNGTPTELTKDCFAGSKFVVISGEAVATPRIALARLAASEAREVARRLTRQEVLPEKVLPPLFVTASDILKFLSQAATSRDRQRLDEFARKILGESATLDPQKRVFAALLLAHQVSTCGGLDAAEWTGLTLCRTFLRHWQKKEEGVFGGTVFIFLDSPDSSAALKKIKHRIIAPLSNDEFPSPIVIGLCSQKDLSAPSANSMTMIRWVRLVPLEQTTARNAIKNTKDTQLDETDADEMLEAIESVPLHPLIVGRLRRWGSIHAHGEFPLHRLQRRAQYWAKYPEKDPSDSMPMVAVEWRKYAVGLLLITILGWIGLQVTHLRQEIRSADSAIKSDQEFWAEFQQRCKEEERKPGANPARVAEKVTQSLAQKYRMRTEDYQANLMICVPGADAAIELADRLFQGTQAAGLEQVQLRCDKRWEVALAAYGAGHYSKAADTCDDIGRIAGEAGFPQMWLDAKGLQIDSLESLGALEDAKTVAMEVLNWLKELKAHVHSIAFFTIKHVQLLGNLGFFQEAIERLTEMECELAGADHEGPCPMRTNILRELSHQYDSFGNYEAAHSAYKLALAAASTPSDDPEEVVEVHMRDAIAFDFIIFRLKHGDLSAWPEFLSQFERIAKSVKLLSPNDDFLHQSLDACLDALKRKDLSIFKSEMLSILDVLPLELKDSIGFSNTLMSLQSIISTPEEITRLETQVTRVTKVVEGAGSDGDVGRVKALNLRAQQLAKTEKSNKTVEACREAYEKSESLYEQNHPETLSAAYALGVALAVNREFDEANAILSDVVNRRRDNLEPGHTDRQRSVSDWAEVLLASGRGNEAVGLLNQEWRDCVLRWGGDHRQTLYIESWLGKILGTVGQHDKAEAHLSHAFSQLEQLPGVGILNGFTLDAGFLLANLLVDKTGDEKGVPLLQRLINAENEIGLRRENAIAVSIRLFNVLIDRELYAEALPVIEHIVNSRRALVGKDTEQVLHDVNSWCIVLHRLGRDSEAEQMARGAQQRWKEIQTHNSLQSPVAIGTQCWLANALSAQKKYGEAEPLFRDVLAAREKLASGEETHEVLMDCQNLGNLLYDIGRFSEAETLYRRVLAGRVKTHPPEGEEPEHETVLDVLNRLANSLYNQKKYLEAEQFYRRALDGRSKQVNAHSSSVHFTVARNLGCLLYDQGRYVEAEALFISALAGRRKVFKEGHEEILDVLNRLGNSLYRQKRYAEAEPFYREAWTSRENQAEGKVTEEALSVMQNLAGVLNELTKFDEAEKLYRNVLDGRDSQSPGKETEATLSAAEQLGWFLLRREIHIEPKAIFKRTLDARTALSGKLDPKRLEALHGYAIAVEAIDGPKLAEPLYLECFSGIEKALGKEDPKTAHMALHVGEVLHKRGANAEAKELAWRAYRGLLAASGKDDRFTKRARRLLINLGEDPEPKEPNN